MNSAQALTHVSVVIPSYNGKHLLEKHLPVVEVALGKHDEIIVVDDASFDDTVEFLHRRYPRVRIVKHRMNMRFAQSCNDGVAAARNDIIFLLNNDVSPQKDVLMYVLRHFSRADVFAVGCLEKRKDGTTAGRSIGRFARGFLVHNRAQNQKKPTTLWAAGGSMVFRRSMFLHLGGMDVMYRPAYQEDIDLSYRALKHGWEVVFEPNAIVFHDHESTNRTAIGRKNMEIYHHKNAFLFMWKNVTDKSILFEHLLWLPYHLTLTALRTKGRILAGFFLALFQLPEALRKRKEVERFWRYTDHAVIQKAGQV